MKGFFRRFAVLSAFLLTFSTFSCGKDKVEEINDSQEQSESDIAPAKAALTVAVTSWDGTDFTGLQHNENYDLKIIDYRTEENGEKCFEHLTMDILSGKAPDIVAASPESMEKLAGGNYLADLYPLMDKAEKDSFLANVLEGLEREGRLPSLCTGFDLFTAAAKTKNVSAYGENWSYNDAFEAFYNMPEDCDFLYRCYTESDIDNYFMKRTVRDAVDIGTGSCDLTGFADVLSRTSKLPYFENRLNWLADEFQSIGTDMDYALINDKALVDEIVMNGINTFTAFQLCSDFGGADITFVGYPSDKGTGYYAVPHNMLGIMESSFSKEAAWSFLSENFFSSAFQKNASLHFEGIPVIDEVMEELFEVSQWTGGSINEPVQLPDNSEKTLSITDEQKQQLSEYIKGAKLDMYYPEQLDSMFREEYSGVLNGEKEIDECTDVLESRCIIYLSEKE